MIMGRRPLPHALSVASPPRISLLHIALALASAPALAIINEQTATDPNNTYSTDGSGGRVDWLLGAYQQLSVGVRCLRKYRKDKVPLTPKASMPDPALGAPGW